MDTYDVIITGGGAAGLLSAVLLSEKGKTVALIEKNPCLGKKLLASGNGRCNFTNTDMNPKQYYCGKEGFADTVLPLFPPSQCVSLFHRLGILAREKDGYVYPYTNQSSTIVERLTDLCRRYHVNVFLNETVTSLVKKDDFYHIRTNRQKLKSKYIFLAAGGIANAPLGGSGNGYRLCKQLGHHISDLTPGLTGLLSKDNILPEMKGVRVQGRLDLAVDERQVKSVSGEIQFIEHGISGIPAFQLCHEAGIALSKGKKTEVMIDFVPVLSKEECMAFLQEHPLSGLVNRKCVSAIMGKSKSESPDDIAAALKRFPVVIEDTAGFDKAQITVGGVDLNEIKPESMESKLSSGLYILGELLDIDGLCGGYNLHFAWASAVLAAASVHAVSDNRVHAVSDESICEISGESILLKISQCRIKAELDSEEVIKKEIAGLLHIEDSEVKSYQILKKSLDARKKPFLFFEYSIAVELMPDKSKILPKWVQNPKISFYKQPVDFKKQIPVCRREKNTVIIGAGPAGLFAAYILVLAGCHPIIVERGEPVDARLKTVKRFWEEGILNPNSNVSFGEGGAGTFSDGKLNTGNKDKTGCFRFILETFVKFGAPAEILFDSKPHIGTDLLIGVIRNMRKEIERLGGTFSFHTVFTSPEIKDGRIRGISCRNSITGQEHTYPCDHCILAIGHSANDTYFMLHEKKIRMEPKAFAVGVRVEHLQKMIDKSQYGSITSFLGAADYKLTGRTKTGRNVYSFCMCPGGFVVNASSGEGKLVVNGMSNQDRSEKNANSAVVVSVTPEDFTEESPLAGISFRDNIEKSAWKEGMGKIPIQYYKDFKKNIPSVSFEGVTPNAKGDTILSNVRKLLPKFIGDAVEEAVMIFGKKIAGFDREDTLISGVETRTSSPVRIPRDTEFQSNIKNLYPCGEGAGYAGGILSAAADGCKTALQICSEEDA